VDEQTVSPSVRRFLEELKGGVVKHVVLQNNEEHSLTLIIHKDGNEYGINIVLPEDKHFDDMVDCTKWTDK